MKTKNMNSKKIIYFLLFFTFTLIFNREVHAQIQLGYTQNQANTAINTNDLGNVKIDDLSDDQLMSFIKQFQTNGVTTIEEVQQVLLKKGLPKDELEKLKVRLAKLKDNVGKKKQAISTEDSIQNNIEKEEVKAKLTIGKEGDENQLDTAKNLTVYGQSFFRKSDIKIFDRSIDAKAPENYTLGVGDELGITIFGYSYFNEVLKIDSRGAINLGGKGPIFIKGLTFSRAKEVIRVKLGQFFDLGNNKVDITLAYSRSITVNIVGEVSKPGSYKIPALNTAFNALMVAGGPNDLGSFRDIEVRRGGKTIKNLDVYEFLNNPNSKQDFFLEENDYIVVKPASKTVSIGSEVKRPMKYELLPNEKLGTLIKYAGGFTSNAYKERIQVLRSVKQDQRMIDINYDSLINTKGDYDLKDGDIIIIRKIIPEYLNFIDVRGSVKLPGFFEFKKGDRVSDLIKIAGGLRYEAIQEKAYLIRLKPDLTRTYISIDLKAILENPNNPNNLELQHQDVIKVSNLFDFTDQYQLSVFGSVRSPGGMVYSDGMTLADAIFRSGGMKIEADHMRIEVSRISFFSDNYKQGEKSKINVLSITLPNGGSMSESELNFKLEPYDEVFVRAIPNFNMQQNMTIEGEAKYPGTYAIVSKTETIKDVIKRSGGLTNAAFAQGATLYRPSLPGGYIVMNLEDVMNKSNSKFNYVIKENDVLRIPTIIDFIGIQGSSIEYLKIANNTQINAPFSSGKRANFYINKYGNGFSKTSWRRKTYVLDNNAKINKTRKILFVFNLYPKVRKGSVIYVVNKIPKNKIKDEGKERVDWNKQIENSMVKLTGLLTVFILVNQIK